MWYVDYSAVGDAVERCRGDGVGLDAETCGRARVGVPDPGPRPRRAEVASAGAASLPVEPWVVRGRYGRFDLAASI